MNLLRRLWFLPQQLFSYLKPLPAQKHLDIPRFQQWESSWKNSGAESPAEYRHWSKDLCGMACLKMVLKHKLGVEHCIITLGKLCQQYGGYSDTSQEVLGLYYYPFKRFIQQEFGLTARVYPCLSFRFILHQLTKNRYCIVSVHHSIGRQSKPPFSAGGHLILLTGFDLNRRLIFFNNPSKNSRHFPNQVTFQDFQRAFAHRGHVID